MGGIIDCGIGVDSKTSPRRAAIEKAQEELRQEFDVREERRRELEFLEKGGNPLDFKFGHVATVSVQSTSLTDQVADQYVTSEAKGSFAFAASPRGDSVESSGKPGGSVGREPNIADNILLLDGENSNLGGDRNVKRSGKRSNLALMEQSSQIGGSNNAKESDDSVIFRFGVKSQAYARRNRSRSTRDIANVGTSELGLRHGNRTSVIPSSCIDLKEAKQSVRAAEDHVASSISNSKETSPNGNAVSKTVGSNYQLGMEMDGVQAHPEVSNVMKNEVSQITTEANTSETLPEIVHNNQQPDINVEAITNGTISRTSDVIEKEDTLSMALHSSHLECNENKKDVEIAEITNCFAPEKSVNIHGGEMNGKSSIPDTTTGAATLSSKEPDSSCDRMTDSIDGHANEDQVLMSRKADGSLEGVVKDHPAFEGASTISHNHGLKENGQVTTVDPPNIGNDIFRPANPSLSNSVVQVKDEMEIGNSRKDAQNEVRQLVSNDGDVIVKPERKLDNSIGDPETTDRSHSVRSTFVSPTNEVTTSAPLVRNATSTSDFNNSGVNQSKLSKKEHEDAILRKARMIEANLKRAGELSSCNLSLEKRQKCHWDFVLEEMTWMANDFMQERLWKTTAASQVCRWIASGGRAKFEQVNMQRKQENMARTLAKAVLHFWRSAEILQSTGEAPNVMHENDSNMSRGKPDGAEAEKQQGNKHAEEKAGKVVRFTIQDYAIRFLKYNSSTSDCLVLAEAPTTPDRVCSLGILEVSYQLSDVRESLFYSVPPGAMQAYRESVESQWTHYKKMGNTVHQEDCETSMCDSIADGPHENAYEEDEGETCTYLLPGTYKGGILSSKSGHKKRKNMQQRAYATRIFDVGADISYEPCLESKSANQPLLLNGKRPPNSLNVGQIPTKRIRTAARQRVVSPFIIGVSGQLQVSSKTDASSGDTNSYQDDQSSLHGGSLHKKNMEVESTVDFDRQLSYDDSEVSKKSKKKKKPKHFGYKNSLSLTDSRVLMVSGKGSYGRRSEVDPMVQHDQKKRLESQHYDSNGNSVVYGQHAAKKPKLLKQVPDMLQEAITPATGSMPSPVASQMSNMSNPNKLIKIIANRDRGRKNKALKMAAGNSGSGSPWSNFEDQALVVLVHDMGPNWELVSDAINSTLQFKCIFRKPKECKERHKFLMDKSAGDGADSAEDSGSSQPYPSTLPGIPKGSARQLFQRLQGPLEEDTLKAHFEKIILLGQHLHSRCNQNDGQEQKQITPPHSSHVVALSQACPNNLGGGFLTPLDLCDAITSSPEVLPLGYQGPHTNGIPLPGHQGSISPILPTSNVNSMLPGSPGMVLSSSLPSPSTPLSGSTRDAQRYGVPRATSLPGDEQQRMQYSQMLSGRNLQQPSLSVPGPLTVGVDRGARILPGGNGMGMMCGINRGMAMPRPGFQGVNHPGMLNMVPTANMLPTNGHGMQNTVNVQQGAVSGPGSSLLRPRESLPMLRPGQNIDDHRQMMLQELHMQVSQGNGQAAPPFSGVSAPFPSAAGSSPVQSFQVQQSQQPHQIPQQPHQMPQQPHLLGNPHHSHIQGMNHSSPQQQAYAIRFAKERQIQQRMMTQPQPGFSGPASTMASMQNSSQIQQPTQSSVSTVPSAQAQHKQQHITHNQPAGSGMPNQIMKQRQRQQAQQQQSRQSQQQRQQTQQAKLMKGLGRGSMLMHQNQPVDTSQASGFSNTPKNQVPEKNLVQQGQGFFPGNATLNSSLPQPGNQSKLYPRPLPQSSKQASTVTSHSDSSNQGPVQGSPSQTLLASQQPHVPPSLPLSNHQQQQLQINPSQQNTQRGMVQQNRQLNPDGRIESPADQAQVSQMIPVSSIAQCTDSGSSPVVSSLTQWKKEPSFDIGTRTSTAHLASSPHETLAGNEMLLPSSSQGLLQRQMSGGVSIHGHNVGGQWQQQQQQPQHQHQHRPVTPGNVYAEPSNTGPG